MSPMLEKSISDLVTVVATGLSGLAGLLALPLAWAANRTAKRAFALSERESQLSDTRLNYYLADATSSTDDPACTELSISLIVTNPATQPETIVRAELAVQHLASQGALLSLLLPPHATPEEPSVLPLRLEAKDAKSIALSFRVPKGLAHPDDIRRFALHFADSLGRSKELAVSNPTELQAK